MFANQITRINFYLIIILPVALISGPLISDLIVVTSCILLFAYFKMTEFSCIYKDKIIWALVLLWIVSISSSLISKDILYSLKSSFFFIRIILFIIIINFLLKKNEKELDKFLNVLITIFFILFFDSIFQKVMGYNIIGLVSPNVVRVSSFFGDELILGSYLVKFYPLLIGLLYLYKNSKFNLYFFLISLITFITVFLSAEKAAIAIFFMEFIFLLFVLEKNLKEKIMILCIPFLLFFVLLSSFPEVKERIYTNLKKNSNNFKYIYTKVHHEHYLSSYKMFKDHKIIGIGPKMYRKHCEKKIYKVSPESCSTHPHNFSFQFLSETGTMGFVLYIIFYILLLNDLIKLIFKKKYSKFRFSLISVILLSLLNFMPLFPSGNFYNNWLSIINSVPLGFYLYFKFKYKESI